MAYFIGLAWALARTFRFDMDAISAEESLRALRSRRKRTKEPKRGHGGLYRSFDALLSSVATATAPSVRSASLVLSHLRASSLMVDQLQYGHGVASPSPTPVQTFGPSVNRP